MILQYVLSEVMVQFIKSRFCFPVPDLGGAQGTGNQASHQHMVSRYVTVQHPSISLAQASHLLNPAFHLRFQACSIITCVTVCLKIENLISVIHSAIVWRLDFTRRTSDSVS